MRRSGWVLPAAALAVFVAAIGYPAVAALGALIRLPRTGADVRSPADLLATSLAWAAAVALGAVVIGWAPGRFLGRALQRRGYVPIATAMLVPVCIPAYVVFWCWWQMWPADSALARWAIETGNVQLVRQATLWLGLVCWSWPLVAWCVAGFVAAIPAEHDELLMLDGAGMLPRLLDHLRSDGRGLAMGGLIVFLAAFNNTTCFDLAQIFTFGNELRAVAEMGGNARDVLAAAAPSVVLAAAGAGVVWWLLARRAELRPPTRGRPPSVAASSATAAVWAVSVLVPVALLLPNLGGWSEIVAFQSLYGGSLAKTVTLALGCAVIAAVVAVGLAMTWQDHRRWVRAFGDVQAVGWLLGAVVPGTMMGVAIEAAYNKGVLSELVYANPAVLVVGHMARFGFVGALVGRALIGQEPPTMRDLRRLDGAETLWGMAVASWPRLLAAAVSAAAVVGVLSLGEIPVTARVHPPGSDPLALALLNAMHYQRASTVMLATVAIIGAAIVGALLAVSGWWWLGKLWRSAPVRAITPALVIGICLSGCGAVDPNDPPPLRPLLVFGSPGQSLGQFNYPRGIAVDGERGVLFIVDKSARVQRFSLDGEPQLEWRMPIWELGKPTGLNVAPDGRVFVADTHYFRVIAYDQEGTELMRFGSYGEGPGEFIFPTDVEFGPEGRLYVSEYGGNDRIQVFDADGRYLFEFGSFGSAAGQFNRPQSMVFNPDKTELYVADACNHRIVVVDPEGRMQRILGEAGRGAGQLSYPYDLMLLADGTLLVCEFGNNRIQRLSPGGESLGIYGRVGPRAGELQYPWGVDGTEDRVFVLDSGNNRVQVIRSPG